MKHKITFVLLLSYLSLSAQSDIEHIREEFRDRISKTMKKRKVVGATVAVVTSEGVLWQDNFGYADLSANQPTTAETLFGIGSVTKVFTSMAVMQLNEQGKLNIDQPLSQYLPGLKIKGNSADVTPRNVMTHHSGLPSDIFKGMFSNAPEDYTCLINYINEEYMAGTPNQIRAYSNPGYTLLGHMISETGGMEYPEYIRKHILDPLNMKRSVFNASEGVSLTFDKKGVYKKDVILRDIPAGGLFSSTNELSPFLQALLSQSSRLLQPASYQSILQQQHIEASLNFSDRYALGWNMTHRPHAGDIYYHTGTTLYYNAAIAFSPKADVGVIILTNSENGRSVYREVHAIIESVAKHQALPKENLRVDSLGSKERIKTAPDELQQHTGVYVAPGAYISVFQKRRKLYMKLQGLRLELIPVANDQFVPKVILGHVIPIRLGDMRVRFEDVNGYRVLTSIEEGSGKELIATKFNINPIPPSWKNRVGNYEQVSMLSGEIPFFEQFQLEEKDDLLVFSFQTKNDQQKIEMVLDILDDQRARVAGLGRYGGQSITFKEGIIKAFGIELKKNQE